jgi:hypothetical protein
MALVMHYGVQMRKRFDQLTHEQKLALGLEVMRLSKFGSACIVASAINVDERTIGWPTIHIPKDDEDTEVSMCDIFEFTYGLAKHSIQQEFMTTPEGLLMSFFASTNMEELSVHDAMHTAFCLGVAAVSLLELDFAGVDEVYDQIKGDEHD